MKNYLLFLPIGLGTNINFLCLHKIALPKCLILINYFISNPDVKISRISKGFWMSPKHLAHQFEYLTGCADLTAAVRQNLFVQLGGSVFNGLSLINKLIRLPGKVFDIL